MQGIAAHPPTHLAGVAGFADLIAKVDACANRQGRHLLEVGVLGIGPNGQARLLGRMAQHDFDAFSVAVIIEPANDGSIGNCQNWRASRLRDINAFVQSHAFAFARIINRPLFTVDLRAICAADKIGLQAGFNHPSGFLDGNVFRPAATSVFADHLSDFVIDFIGRDISVEFFASIAR